MLDTGSCPIHEYIFILPLAILGLEKWRKTASKIGQKLSRKNHHGIWEDLGESAALRYGDFRLPL